MWPFTQKDKVLIFSENRPLADAVDDFFSGMEGFDIQHTSDQSEIYLELFGDDFMRDMQWKQRFPWRKPRFDPLTASTWEMYRESVKGLFLPYGIDYITGKERVGESSYNRRIVIIDPDLSSPESVYFTDKEVRLQDMERITGERDFFKAFKETHIGDNYDSLEKSDIGGMALVYDLWTIARGRKGYMPVILATQKPEVVKVVKKILYIAGSMDLTDSIHPQLNLPLDYFHSEEVAIGRLQKYAAKRLAAATFAMSTSFVGCSNPQPKPQGMVIREVDRAGNGKAVLTAGTEDIKLGVEDLRSDNDQQSVGLYAKPVDGVEGYAALSSDPNKKYEGRIIFSPFPEKHFRLLVGGTNAEQFGSINLMADRYSARNNGAVNVQGVYRDDEFTPGTHAWFISEKIGGLFLGGGKTPDDTRFVLGLPHNDEDPAIMLYQYAGNEVEQGLVFATKSSGVLEPMGFAKFLENRYADPARSRIESPVRFFPPPVAQYGMGWNGQIVRIGDEWTVEGYRHTDGLVFGGKYKWKEGKAGTISLPLGYEGKQLYIQFSPLYNTQQREPGFEAVFRVNF